MNEKKQKKIRAYLINFVNEELIRKKRNNKKDILINSTSLDILAQKNMQCKVFFVEEHKFFYQQNMDIGWIMGVNFDLNNSYPQKPLMDLFSNKVAKVMDKIDSSDIEEEKIEIVNKETIIKKNLDRILYIHHEKEIGSPLGTSLFQKKEISERKIYRENKDYLSGKVSNFFMNKNDNQKDDIKLKDTNSFENFMLIKRYSNITLETELSRIIRCCHDEDCPSSQEHCILESRRSEMNKGLKIARMYAKRLNLYCKTLKNNFKKKYLKGKKLNFKKKKNTETKKETNFKNENADKNKGKIHNIQKFKFQKIKPKKHNEEHEEKNYKMNGYIKKAKTNNFLKIKAINESDKNNIQDGSSHIKGNITTREDMGNHKKSLLKINPFQKRNSSTFRNKLALKLKQVYFKSPKKIDTFKRKISKQIGEGEYKKININQRLLNNIVNPNKEIKEVNHIQKVIKTKKKQENKNEKTSNFRISKMKYVKRGSMMDNMNYTGLEKINFFKTKTKSTFSPLVVKPIKKKSKKKKEKINNNNNINNINNKSTSISQKKDTSDSSEILPKDYEQKVIKNKYHKKNSTSFLMKRKKGNLIIENWKKIKKRRSSNYDNAKIHKIKRISPLKSEREKRNNTTEKNEQIFGKLHDLNEGDVEVTDFDDFNVIDEFLYKIKVKRGKNCNVIGMN